MLLLNTVALRIACVNAGGTIWADLEVFIFKEVLKKPRDVLLLRTVHLSTISVLQILARVFMSTFIGMMMEITR